MNVLSPGGRHLPGDTNRAVSHAPVVPQREPNPDTSLSKQVTSAVNQARLVTVSRRYVFLAATLLDDLSRRRG